MKFLTGCLAYGRDTIRYEVRFLASRRTLAIEVHPDCRVLVRAPADCPEDVIADRVRKRADWISRQVAEFERYRPRSPARQYVSGESHLYLGRQYRLKVLAGEAPSVQLSRGLLLVKTPRTPKPEQVRAIVQRWYFKRARAVFGQVLEARLKQFDGVKPPRMVVRAMRTRWGSFSPAGTLSLNVNLVRAPRACIEYVVTHELCHAVHRDHGHHFYRLLGRLLPDWRERKDRLESALL